MTNTATKQPTLTVDMQEIAKFTALANHWWDTTKEFAPLHQINPLRLNWIDEKAGGLVGKTVLDVGCGGGILAESMAKRGATVLGIDLGEANIEAAKIHAEQQQVANLSYQYTAIETLAESQAGSYDVVTCMEMLEHVPQPAQIIAACQKLLKPNGVAIFSTINRNPKSYLFAIVGAEYVLNLVPRGTHEYSKFIKPSELDLFISQAGLKRTDLIGLHYNPVTKNYWLAQNVDVNYMFATVNPEAC